MSSVLVAWISLILKLHSCNYRLNKVKFGWIHTFFASSHCSIHQYFSQFSFIDSSSVSLQI